MDQKILVVYYSLEGNTEFVAKEIGRCTGADLLRLVPEKEIPVSGFGKYFFGGKAALTHSLTHLNPFDEKPEEYGTIVLAGPVWAGTYPPAIGTFLDEHRFSGKISISLRHQRAGMRGSFSGSWRRYSPEIRSAVCSVSRIR